MVLGLFERAGLILLDILLILVLLVLLILVLILLTILQLVIRVRYQGECTIERCEEQIDGRGRALAVVVVEIHVGEVAVNIVKIVK